MGKDPGVNGKINITAALLLCDMLHLGRWLYFKLPAQMKNKDGQKDAFTV